MKPTRVSTLLAVAFCCGAVCWLLLRILYASLPPLPWTAAPTLLFLAVVEGASGRSLRLRLRSGQDADPGRPGATRRRPIPPIAVARVAALAKASSLAAAIFGGLAAGALVYLSASLGKPAPRQDAIASGATLATAVLLAAAALYLEHGCRVPPPPKGSDELPPPPPPSPFNSHQ
jgi:Protein of unknown function (DUF3180)